MHLRQGEREKKIDNETKEERKREKEETEKANMIGAQDWPRKWPSYQQLQSQWDPGECLGRWEPRSWKK